MRKLLIALLSLLVLGLTVYVVIDGITFANVNGYKKINKINNELDLNIAKINNIKEKEYIERENSLNAEIKTLEKTREEYLAKVEAARVKGAKGSKVQLEVYELDFIWARVGNYASDLGLEIKLDLFPGTEEKTLNDFKLYNLKFSVLGEYTDIVRFIYKIEGDNELSAQISDFSMTPTQKAVQTENDEGKVTEASISTIASEFTLKNVPLNHKNIIEDVNNSSSDTTIQDLGVDSSDPEIKKLSELGVKLDYTGKAIIKELNENKKSLTDTDIIYNAQRTTLTQLLYTKLDKETRDQLPTTTNKEAWNETYNATVKQLILTVKSDSGNKSLVFTLDLVGQKSEYKIQ